MILQGNPNCIIIKHISQHASPPDIHPRMLRHKPSLPNDMSNAVQNIYDSLKNKSTSQSNSLCTIIEPLSRHLAQLSH